MTWFGRRLVDYLVLAGLIAGVYFVSRYVGVLDSEGPVVVVDGDSLRLNHRKIRLHGIDAPELDQTCWFANGQSYACGRKAKAHLRQLIARQDVNCRLVDVDRYNRDIAVCTAGDQELNAAMVRDGWAVAYQHHSINYIRAEKQARQKRKGIWRGKFEPPREWRLAHPR